MTIVGLGHVARVGKDVAAAALSRDLGYRRIAFADKLRELALAADPIVTGATQTANIGIGRGRLSWVVQGIGWEEAKEIYPEVRKFLQDLGLGARKTFGEDFWVERALHNVSGDVVVSDVRFHNEAEAIRDRGGFLIRIDRPGRHAEGHVSETALAGFEGWDAVIVNDGTVQDLEMRVVQVVKDLTAPKIKVPRKSAKIAEATGGELVQEVVE
jgi:hypothetical protein